MVAMATADEAVHRLLAREVLQPSADRTGLDDAVELLLTEPGEPDRRVRLERRLAVRGETLN